MSEKRPPISERRPSIIHSPTGLSEQEVIREAAIEGHDADVPGADGFILTEEEEQNLRRSISRRHEKALSRQNTLEAEEEHGLRKSLSHALDKVRSRRNTAKSPPHSEKPHDLEAGIEEPSSSRASVAPEEEEDPNVVWWDGPDDPKNPRNWGGLLKWSNIVLISLITLLTPLASSICAPAMPEIMADLKITDTRLATFVVSVYVLGFAIGPLIIAPLSEVFGRVPLYHICNVCFVAFTVGCAKSTSPGMLIGFRFLCGCVGSCPLTNGGGSIHDIVPAEKRGKVAGVFGLGPLLGPIIGPIGGGFLSEAKGWRWVFYVIAIVSGVFTIICFICMRETYAPTILERKTKALRKKTGNMELRSKLDTGLSTSDLVRHAILRPLKILFLSPIVICFSLYLSVIYGYIYLLFTTITPIYMEHYHWSTGITGLAYIGMGIGSFISLFIFSSYSDKLMQKRATQDHAAIKPEYRLPPLIYGAGVIPIGLFWYGWSADQNVHWIMPILGTVWIGAGMLLVFMCTLTYIVDSFAMYAASALAANTVLRSLVGCSLPLAGTPMYDALGLGWGNSLLGFIALAFAPIPLIFSRYGEWMRTRFEIKNL